VDSNTTPSEPMMEWIVSASTLRVRPVSSKSTPSITPSGRAVMKLPEMIRIAACDIGVFGKPWLKAASMSRRSSPAASLAHSMAAVSVMRTPLWKRPSTFRRASCSATCGREP